MHLFSPRTPAGVLYEVDTQLRPSGSAGMLVSTFLAFEDYPLNEAWTWEHQALVRALIMYGSLELQEGFNTIRGSGVCLPRDPATLRREVREICAKMRSTWPASRQPFLISRPTRAVLLIPSFWHMRHAAEKPELTRW